VSVENGVGSFDVETSNGRITIDAELLAGGTNRMRTSNGSITVTLLGEPSIELDASTGNGSVSSDHPILTTNSGDHHLRGTIGGGAAGLVIRTSNGSATIR